MAILTCYWPAWACDEARAQGLEGQPIDALFGGQDHASSLRGRVAVGDTVVAVTVRAGAVYLLASLRVTATADDALACSGQQRGAAVLRAARLAAPHARAAPGAGARTRRSAAGARAACRKSSRCAD
jgi:hypothetical protein